MSGIDERETPREVDGSTGEPPDGDHHRPPLPPPARDEASGWPSASTRDELPRTAGPGPLRRRRRLVRGGTHGIPSIASREGCRIRFASSSTGS